MITKNMKPTAKGYAISDFVILFNVFWYRDFPLSAAYKRWASRAEWTIHLGIVVRACADALGLFTYFESSGRTDAVMKDNQGSNIVHLEWEWESSAEKVNEIQKLVKQSDKAQFSVFISSCEDIALDRNLQSITSQWGNCTNTLLVFLILFHQQGRNRDFMTLETYQVVDGVPTPLRSQPALPWDVKGTRWELEKTDGK